MFSETSEKCVTLKNPEYVYCDKNMTPFYWTSVKKKHRLDFERKKDLHTELYLHI